MAIHGHLLLAIPILGAPPVLPLLVQINQEKKEPWSIIWFLWHDSQSLGSRPLQASITTDKNVSSLLETHMLYSFDMGNVLETSPILQIPCNPFNQWKTCIFVHLLYYQVKELDRRLDRNSLFLIWMWWRHAFHGDIVKSSIHHNWFLSRRQISGFHDTDSQSWLPHAVPSPVFQEECFAASFPSSFYCWSEVLFCHHPYHTARIILAFCDSIQCSVSSHPHLDLDLNGIKLKLWCAMMTNLKSQWSNHLILLVFNNQHTSESHECRVISLDSYPWFHKPERTLTSSSVRTRS